MMSEKDMTEQGVARAVEMVEHSSLCRDRVLVIYLPECHESLAGIIAGDCVSGTTSPRSC